MTLNFTTDHCDALQEIVNIAMGRTGAQLAELLGVFVKLSVPRIQLLESAELARAIEPLTGPQLVTAVRQSFQNEMHGEAITLFGEASCPELADLMGYDTEINTLEQRELLLDLSNMLVGGCLGSVFEQFGQTLGFSPPSIMAEKNRVPDLIAPQNLPWRHVLLVEVRITLEERAFSCHLLVLMPDSSLDLLRASVERFIESY